MISCFKGKFKVTSPRGYRIVFGKKEYHKGIDLVALGSDKNVYAIADGTVDAVLYEKNGFGYYIRQKLSDGRRVYYAHLKETGIAVKNGQAVKQGEKLGVMGATGRVTGAHTHLELRPKGTSGDSLDICELTGIPNKVGTYTCKPRTAIVTGNDIVWELMNGKHKIDITEPRRAIQALDKAKTDSEFCSLYWILYKLVNK